MKAFRLKIIDCLLTIFHTYQPADKPLLPKCVKFLLIYSIFACVPIHNVWAYIMHHMLSQKRFRDFFWWDGQ